MLKANNKYEQQWKLEGKHNFHPNTPSDQDENGLSGWFILFILVPWQACVIGIESLSNGDIYGHVKIAVVCFAVKLFSLLIIASYDVRDMTREFGEMFSYTSSTFLYLPGH